MKFSLARKLSLWLFLAVISVLAGALWFVQLAVKNNFERYLEDAAQLYHERVASVLVESYNDNDSSWAGLDSFRFRRLLRLEQLRISRAERPPGPPPSVMKPSMRRRSVRDIPSLRIYDQSGALIYGLDSDLPDHRDIESELTLGDGSVVRLITSHPVIPTDGALFLKRQIQSLGLVSIAASIIALAMSLVFTRTLLKPMRRIASNIQALSAGDYGVRFTDAPHDELGLIMRDIDTLASRLEKNRESRQRWLMDISHELRTPLTSLAGEIDTVKDGIRPLDEVQIDSIDQEVQRLKKLVDDLYQLSLSDAGGLRYEFSTLDLSEFLRQIAKDNENRIAGAGHRLTVSVDDALTIRADEARLDQLFVNLIGNAIAYTDAPGEIRLGVSNGETHALINIEDSSPGVDPSEFEALFEPLYRNDESRNRRKGGAGLGLAICENIVEAHQGDIQATSSDLGGLKIQIRLPLVI
ncbi:MAG: ATP-binding protein [Pseudomonadota bacterium]